jgi:cysteine desulfurase
MYGPKGIGALYVRRGRPRVRLQALIDGGGHERGLRSGTLPVHQIVGLGKAAELCKEALEGGRSREDPRSLRDRLWSGSAGRARRAVPQRLVGAPPAQQPQRLFAYVEGEAMMMGIKASPAPRARPAPRASLEPSYVLRALGVDVELAHTSIRFGSVASTPRPRSTRPWPSSSRRSSSFAR